MEVDLIFRIAAIGIIVAVLNQVLTRSGRDDMAMMTTLAGVIVVLMMMIPVINSLFDTVKNTFSLYRIAWPAAGGLSAGFASGTGDIAALFRLPGL